MKTLTINIEPKGDGYVCIATNGDLPFEGRIHTTIENAFGDLNAAYDNNTWHGKKNSNTQYSIDIN